MRGEPRRGDQLVEAREELRQTTASLKSGVPTILCSMVGSVVSVMLALLPSSYKVPIGNADAAAAVT